MTFQTMHIQNYTVNVRCSDLITTLLNQLLLGATDSFIEEVDKPNCFTGTSLELLSTRQQRTYT